MANTIVNPTGSTRFFSVNGGAIGSQPVNDKSTITGPGTVSTDSASVSAPRKKVQGHSASRALVGYKDLISLAVDAESEVTVGVYAGNMSVNFSLAPSEAFAVGDFLYTDKGYLTPVLAVLSTTAVVIALDFDTANTFRTAVYSKVPKDAVVQNRAGEFLIFGNTASVAGSANSAINGGATGPNRSTNKAEAVRTRRVGTAIRAGYWDHINGEFTTAPTVANDASALAIASDSAITSTHKVTYLVGAVPTTVTNSN